MPIQKILLSPCHQDLIMGEKRGKAVVGVCKTCGRDVTRYNFATWKQEWLNGSWWRTKEPLVEVQESDYTIISNT